MSLKRTSKRGHSTMSELNITPLLDLVFVLLVIFIITTPQMVNNLSVALPTSKPPPQDPNKPKPEINRIVVDDNGQTFLNGQGVSVAQLKSGLQDKKTAEPEVGVSVKGSDLVDFQQMVSVLDVLHQLDITNVVMVTK